MVLWFMYAFLILIALASLAPILSLMVRALAPQPVDRRRKH